MGILFVLVKLFKSDEFRTNHVVKKHAAKGTPQGRTQLFAVFKYLNGLTYADKNQWTLIFRLNHCIVSFHRMQLVSFLDAINLMYTNYLSRLLDQ